MLRRTGSAVLLLIWGFLAFVRAGCQDYQSKGSESQPGALVPVERDGKWGYADANRNIIIAPQFYGARKFSDGLAAVYVQTSVPSNARLMDSGASKTATAETKVWGFIDSTGRLVIAPEFAAVEDFSEGLTAVSRGISFSDRDTWGYINKRGEMVIKPQFSAAYPFSEGLALVWAGGVRLTDPIVKSFVKMGYIDKAGKWVISSRFKYFFFDSFSEGVVPFRKNLGKWGYMNRNGKAVIKPRFEWAGSFSQGSAPVLMAGGCAHVDKVGHVIGPLAPQASSTRQKRAPEQDRHGTYTSHPRTPPCS